MAGQMSADRDPVGTFIVVVLFAISAIAIFTIGMEAGRKTSVTPANVDVGQKCATVLDSCMSTLKTCTEALQKGAVK